MQDTFDYVRNFGSLSFEDMPFNELDNVNICQMFYMQIEKVSPLTFADEPKRYADVANDLYSFNGNKHVGPGLVLSKKHSVKMMLMASVPRYADMMVYAVHSVFNERPAVQFCGGTFVLSDGTIVVCFRGTDDSIVGWKEDVDIYTKHGIPSHQLSVDYLKAVCEKFPEGDIIVCGHSKGGNVALYSALASDKAIRDRIVTLYNNEGPGFDTYAWYSTPAYKELLPRYKHFIPTSALIGVMLAHDNDYEVIKSKRLLGPLQHDISFLRTQGDRFERAKDLNLLGKFCDKFLNRLIFGIDEGQARSFDKVVEAVMLDGIASAAFGLKDVPRNIQAIVKGTSDAYNAVDESDRDVLKSYMGGTSDMLRSAAGDTVGEATEKRKAEREGWKLESGEGDNLAERLATKRRARIDKFETMMFERVNKALKGEDDAEEAPAGAEPSMA